MRKLSLLIALGVAGCNTYDLTPVKPATAKLIRPPALQLAQPHPPDLVFVVDRSGSMADAADGSALQVCPSAGQQHLSCKWDTLLSVLTGDAAAQDGYLSQVQSQSGSSSDPIRMGLVTFSGDTGQAAGSVDEACRPGMLAVPVQPSAASAMSAALEVLPPAGATPTASSLQVAASAFPVPAAGEVARHKIVVLLTDGAPNCNASATVDASSCGGDRCTFLCDSATGISTDPRGCLDENGLVSTVSALHDQGIDTMVIGFGADVSAGAAYQTLEQAALAGGMRRRDSNNQPLEPAFYPASDAASLRDALGHVQPPGTCGFVLDAAPVADDAIEVNLTLCGQHPQVLAQSQFQLDGRYLTISDPNLCAEIGQATPECPNQLQFAYLAK